MKRINMIDLYVDGNDPSTGVVISDDNCIYKAVLINNANGDTLQVEMPYGDETGDFRGNMQVFGLTAPASPKTWEAARQLWIDAFGTEPTEDELLVALFAVIKNTGVGIAPAGVNLATLKTQEGGAVSGVTAMFPISGYAQVYAVLSADTIPKAKSVRTARAKATLTFISE